MKNKKLHMIGNGHLDPVWLWRWQEGFQETKATFRSALDRMNEYDDFIFTSSSTLFFEWIENNDPAMFEEIKQRVAEGRFEITGGWIIEPDCNIPSGESFVRQGLYGQRYFQSRFGKIATIGYNVDSFGHAGSLPQILKKQGMDSYVFMRPMPNEKSLPSRVFRWQSQDGSEVLAYRLPYEYNTWGKSLERNMDRLKTEFQEDVDELMFFYGVGNHGGGPTKENIESIYTLNTDESNPEMVFSTTEQFFQNMRDSGREFPAVMDDLQHHASGCYSAHSGIKRWNRKGEQILQTAEKFSVFAKVINQQPYPKDFEHAWKTLLFNQFHDTLAGTSLISAYEDARIAYGEAANIASRNLNYGIQSLSWAIDIPEDTQMKPIVVFNPHGWDAKLVVEIEARDFKGKNFKLLDDEGNVIPAQCIQSETVTHTNRLLFVADVPSLGYRTYRFYMWEDQDLEMTPVRATDTSLENSRFLLEINPDSGNIKTLYDKKQEVSVFRREAAYLSVINDTSDTWSHNVFTFDDVITNMKPVSVRLVEEGPVRSTLRVKYQYNDSYVTQEFQMYAALDYIPVKVTIDWREPLTMLKVNFPVNLNFRAATNEIPYGYIERNNNGEEEPGQSWIDFSGETPDHKIYGLGVANDSKYSYSFDVDTMAITLLKNSPYAHHDPSTLDPEVEYTYIDHGVQEVTYALVPHAGNWKRSSLVQRAAEINQEPVALFETYHEGTLPQTDSFVQIDAPQVVITAIKEAEDNDGVIVRAYETLKQPVEATLSLPFMEREVKLSFTPCEIKTIKIPYDTTQEITEVNLLEW